MHDSLAFLTFGALLALLPGCFLFEPEVPGLGNDCNGMSFNGSEPAANRNVALGEGLGADFQPYQPGGEATLVTGGQGSTMITPVLRVDAAPDDPPALCTLVELTTDGGGDGPNSAKLRQIVKLVLSNGHLLSVSTFFDPLDNVHTPSNDLTLTAHVRATNFTATQTITVHGTFESN